MTRETAAFLRRVGELHFQYSQDANRPKRERDVEKAYCSGFYDALLILATEGYTISGKSADDFLNEAEEVLPCS